MPTNADRITELMIKQLNEELTMSEMAELHEWMKESEENKMIAEEFMDDKRLKAGLAEIFTAERNIWQRVEEQMTSNQSGEAPKVRRMNVWSKIAVAASIILVLGMGGYLLFADNKAENTNQGKELVKMNDVPAPDKTKAMITLADGRTIALDSINSGTLMTVNGVVVIKNKDGEIVYEVPHFASRNERDRRDDKEVVYNTLFNPRGSKVVNITLGDGTRVWLNSESSLKYPVAFTGTERSVEITGEAYFEVAKDARKKFMVDANGLTTEVLGTHFNINSYADDGVVKVALLEGSVRVFTDNRENSKVIRPGQQALFNNDAQLTIQDNVDLNEVMAWKNGLFSFNRVDIKAVMRQLARWYDLEVVYEGPQTTDRFWGDIQRDLPLSKTLDFLRKSQVHFEVEGKKIIVKK